MYNEEKNNGMRAPVAFTNMDMVDEPKTYANNELLTETKFVGIYEMSMDTLNNLRLISDMLELFGRELNPTGDTGATWSEPKGFVENVQMINQMTYAIKGDLERLTRLFR